MPLWTIHHTAGSLAGADRTELASEITALYPILPAFYVGVVFCEAAPGALFIGGESRTGFVRFGVDQIARQLPDAAARERWIGKVNGRIAPFMARRSLDWELHIDETSRDLWLIQGQRPPLPDTDRERLWIERNEPVPFGAGPA